MMVSEETGLELPPQDVFIIKQLFVLVLQATFISIYKIHKKYYSVGLSDELWEKRVQDELLVLLQARRG